MMRVGEDLVLAGEVGAARIDEVDAGQPVLGGDFLRAQMLLHGERIIGAALHRRVVGDDHGEAARDLADAGDEGACGHIFPIDIVGGELADFEEGGARIEQAFDAFAGQQLAARDVALARGFGAAEGDFRGAGAELCNELRHGGTVGVAFGALGHLCSDDWHGGLLERFGVACKADDAAVFRACLPQQRFPAMRAAFPGLVGTSR